MKIYFNIFLKSLAVVIGCLFLLWIGINKWIVFFMGVIGWVDFIIFDINNIDTQHKKDKWENNKNVFR